MARPAGMNFTLWSWSDERDGQFTTAGSPWTSPWFSMDGMSKLLLQGTLAGGTSAIIVEMSVDGVNIDHSTADLTVAALVAGVEVNVAYPFARVKVTQTVGNTTNAELALKVAD